MERVPIATSADGVDVYVGRHAEHIELHVNTSPGLLEGVVELVETVELGERPEAFDYDFGRIVGDNQLVETRPGDRVIYALREGRKIPTPFVFEREPMPTSLISLITQRTKYGRELVTAWFGELSPDLPGGNHEQPNSKQFWDSHALLWGSQPVLEDSVTYQRPW